MRLIMAHAIKTSLLSMEQCDQHWLLARRRAFDDDGTDGVLGTSVAGEQLSKRVFMIFMRM